MGSADFRYLSGQPTQVRQVLRRCGNPTKMVVLAGADHQATIANLAGDRGGKILTWLLSHTLTHR
jgi:dipeptidyl aminopeptidase/acylaminoacyl peptidase